MTYTTQTPATSYTGDGSETVFAFPAVRIDNNAELKINVGSVMLAEGPDYTITTVPAAGVTKYPSGLSVTLTVAPVLDAAIVIWRDTSATQPQAYTPFGPFPASSHELQLDRSAMRDDEQNAKLGGFIPVGGNFVTKFNGRNGDVVPGATDYDADDIAETAGRVWYDSVRKAKLDAMPSSIMLGDLGNVTNNPAHGEYAINVKQGTVEQAGQWISMIIPQWGYYRGRTARAGVTNTNRMGFVNTAIDDMPSELGTTDNSSTLGWKFTANKKLKVSATLVCANRIPNSNNVVSANAISLNDDSNVTGEYVAQASRVAMTGGITAENNHGSAYDWETLSVTLILDPGDEITIHRGGAESATQRPNWNFNFHAEELWRTETPA
jgi:hypothetical protein